MRIPISRAKGNKIPLTDDNAASFKLHRTVKTNAGLGTGVAVDCPPIIVGCEPSTTGFNVRLFSTLNRPDIDQEVSYPSDLVISFGETVAGKLVIVYTVTLSYNGCYPLGENPADCAEKTLTDWNAVITIDGALTPDWYKVVETVNSFTLIATLGHTLAPGGLVLTLAPVLRFNCVDWGLAPLSLDVR